MIRRVCVALVLTLCAPHGAAGGAASDSSSAARLFLDLEERLLGAASLRLVTEIESQGAVEFAMAGSLLIAQAGALLDQSGTFHGDPARASLVSDRVRMRARSQIDSLDIEAPEALTEGLVVGFMRMGLLHNIAVLSFGGPPEGTDGNVFEWLGVTGFSLTEPREIDEKPARGVRFEILVGGEPSGEATLWIDPATGLPLRRDQTVQFENGEMTVVERYPVFEIEAEIDPGLFRLGE